MSYTDGGLFEVYLGCSEGTAADFDVEYRPAYQPVTVRAFVVVMATAASCAGVIALDKRPTVGSDASRTEIDNCAISNATAAGAVIYVDGLSTKVSPGESLIAEVTDATGTLGVIHAYAVLEPSPEVPANNSDMSESS